MDSVGNLKSPPSFSAPTWLMACALIVAALLAYWNTLASPFLFDDAGAVTNNPTIRHLGSLAVFLPPADGSTTTGRPIVNFSFAINFAISGDDVRSYHAVNLLIHALAALTLLGVVRRTLAGPVLAARFGAASRPLAFLIALLWTLHPLQTESVVCIAQRTESLCGLFYLLTLYGLIRATETGTESRGRWFIFSFICCACGMGTKEVMATAPLLLFLYDRTFLAGTFSGAWRQRKGFYAALGSTWLLMGLLVWIGGGARGSSAGFGLGISWWRYLLQQCDAIVLYLRLSFWPQPLVLDYGTVAAHRLADVWWQAVLVVALLALSIRALRQRPAAGFLAAWFFVILAPSSSIVPLVAQTMAEHRMYLPLAGIISAAVLVIHAYFGRATRWLLAGLSLASGAMTIARNQDYRDPVTAWTDTVIKRPLNARAHNNLAWALQARGNTAQANVHFARAIELEPDYVSARYNWGVALLDQGRPSDAITQFEAAVRLAPEHADASLNLGNALMRTQRAAEAIPRYEAALRLKPGADVNYDLGAALLAIGNPRDAAPHLRAALAANPALPAAHYQLGCIAEAAGDSAEAEREFTAVLQLAPDTTDAHRKLGLLLARRNRLPAAAEHFRAVIRVQPDDADAQANLGNVLLLDGKPREAITCYQTSLRLRPDDPRTRENLQLARESLR